MFDNPWIWLLVALGAIGAILIYLVIRPKEAVSPKQARKAKEDNVQAEVDKVLREAHIDPNANGDFRVGRAARTSDEELNTDALLTAEAMSKRLEGQNQQKRGEGSG